MITREIIAQNTSAFFLLRPTTIQDPAKSGFECMTLIFCPEFMFSYFHTSSERRTGNERVKILFFQELWWDH